MGKQRASRGRGESPPTIYNSAFTTTFTTTLNAAWGSNWESAAAPVLAGLALAWQLCGLHTIFAAQIDFLPTTRAMVTVLSLLLAAIGAGLPERAMSLVQRLIRQRPNTSADIGADADAGVSADAGGERPSPLWLLSLTRQSDPELPWISLAVLSAAGGVLTMISLALGSLLFETYRRLLAHFFWTNLTMAGMEWATATAILAAPLIAGGLTLVMLAAVADVYRREARHAGQRIVAGVLLGFGLGWLVHGPFSAWGMSAEREVIISSLPLFAIAAMGARASQRAESRKAEADSASPPPPELATGAEMLTGLSSIVWTIGVAAACTGWVACHGGSPAGYRAASQDVGVLLTGVGVVAGLAARLGPRFGPLTAGYGVAVWGCGMGAGGAASLVVWWPDSSASWALQVCLLAGVVGYGIYQVSGYWLARASSGTLGFAHLLVTLLTGTAIGLAASRWWGLPKLGAMGTLAAGALVLLAAGGLLEIYEERQPARTQRLKLALVFASLAAAMVVFPADTRWWTRRDRAAAAMAMARTQPSDVMMNALADVRTACLIGIDPTSLRGSLPALASHVEVMPLASSLPRVVNVSSRDRLQVVAMPAPRWLRLHRMRYQFIYQLTRPVAEGRGIECSAEWLCALADHLAAGGRLMLEVPLAGLSRRDVLIIVATFEHATTSPGTWRLSTAAEPRLILQAGRIERIDHADDATPWHPLDRLRRNTGDLRIHSIRRARVGSDTGDAADDAAAVIQWLSDLADHATSDAGP